MLAPGAFRRDAHGGRRTASRRHDRQYAGERTPREFWDSPVFRHVNRVLTALWGAFALMAVSTWLAVRYPAQDDWFNWVVPIALLVVAVEVTRRCPESCKARVI